MTFHGMINMYIYRIIFVCLLVCDHILCENSIEGEIVKLDFPYPCDSTEVTLQRSNGRPFYSSADSDVDSLPSRYEVRNHTESNSDICYLNLTINPVSRNDESTFILIAYKDGQMLPDYPIIGLRVDYPPGKASCESSSEYVDGEWVKLYCQASLGSLPGQIVCYQDDMRLPSLTSLEVNGDTLNQIMLARLLAGLVYCCTSTYRQTKDRCECKDFRWNPIRNTELSNISDPCAATTETTDQDTATALIQQVQEKSTIYPNAFDPKTVNNTFASNNWFYASITTTCLIALGCIAVIYFLYKARKEKKSSKKESIAGNKDEQHELQELSGQVQGEIE